MRYEEWLSMFKNPGAGGKNPWTRWALVRVLTPCRSHVHLVAPSPTEPGFGEPRRWEGEGGARAQQLHHLDWSRPALGGAAPSAGRPLGEAPSSPQPPTPRLHSGALHLHPVPAVQEDMLQQPVDHVQRLVLLQHDVIGVHVAFPPLFHLPRGREGPESPEGPDFCLCPPDTPGAGEGGPLSCSAPLQGPALRMAVGTGATMNPWLRVQRTVRGLKCKCQTLLLTHLDCIFTRLKHSGGQPLLAEGRPGGLLV